MGVSEKYCQVKIEILKMACHVNGDGEVGVLTAQPFCTRQGHRTGAPGASGQEGAIQGGRGGGSDLCLLQVCTAAA